MSLNIGIIYYLLDQIPLNVYKSIHLVVSANKDINNDLFNGFPNSYGSLGYILSAKIKLMRVKKYVHIHNQKFTNPDNYIEEIKRHKNNSSLDFLDGIILSKDELYFSIRLTYQ